VRPVEGSPRCVALGAHQEALDRDEGVRSGHRFLRLVALSKWPVTDTADRQRMAAVQ
jgi:hypothetical protein